MFSFLKKQELKLNLYCENSVSLLTPWHVLGWSKDDVKSLWSLWIGPRMCHNGCLDNKRQRREPEQIYKVTLSTNRSLKLNCVQLESLVIADHHAAVNLIRSHVHTARRTTKIGISWSFCHSYSATNGILHKEFSLKYIIYCVRDSISDANV